MIICIFLKWLKKYVFLTRYGNAIARLAMDAAYDIAAAAGAVPNETFKAISKQLVVNYDPGDKTQQKRLLLVSTVWNHILNHN
eukprot:COSAG06_NODE_895_length_11669_cov_5.131384_5_plen_83_part_00